MGKYEPLTRYLKSLDVDRVTLTFEDLGDILGSPLPASASNHAVWWKEGSTHTQARGWRDAGWSVVRVDRRDKSVTFRKDAASTAISSLSGAARTNAHPATPPSAQRRAIKPTTVPAITNAAHFSKRALASSLILIPCSASKASGGAPAWRRESTAPALLGSGGDELWDARRELARLVGESAGPDLGGDGVRRAYLPALERYEGLLYQAADFGRWVREDRETLRGSCLIVSGLYGLLTTNESIRDYNVSMKTRLPNGQLVKGWWRKRGLGALLRSHVTQRGVTDIFCFLSADYIDAIGGLDFGEVRVHQVACKQGSDAMREQGRAVARLAQEGLCACPVCGDVTISEAATAPRIPGATLPPPTMATTPPTNWLLDDSRVVSVASALVALGDAVYEAIDRLEPEWPVLEQLAPSGSLGILATIALALDDYQMAAGGAAEYWRVAEEMTSAGELTEVGDVIALMDLMLAQPVMARMVKGKRERANRLFESQVPQWLAECEIADVGREFMSLWNLVASVMGQAPDAKTVALAMKMVDMMHRIVVGQYVALPGSIPIVADFRVGRVCLSSGLLKANDGTPAVRAMELVADVTPIPQPTVRDSWACVAAAADALSLFRVDSLVWQIAEPVYRLRNKPVATRTVISDLLQKCGADVGHADCAASELTKAM